MTRLTLLFSLLITFAASAESRVAVLGFKGPRAADLRAQLIEVLCAEEICVQRGRNGDRTAVDAVVVGTTRWERKRLKLEVKVYESEDVPPVKITMPVPKSGKLTPGQLGSLVASVRSAIPTRTVSLPGGDGTSG